MPGELLLDTGALVSLLDRSQRYHAECVAFFDAWRGPVVSTEPVLTESTHLLSGVDRGPTACVEFFLAGGATMVPASSASLERCRELITRYSDLPMDYADASLVALAEELDARAVFTLDHDFEVYRLSSGHRFELYPAIERPRARRTRRKR